MGRLHYAARRGRLDLLVEALSSGEPVDEPTARGERALHLAAGGGFGRLVDRLVEAGADPNEPDLRGTTPLHLAAQGGHKMVAERLLACGASIDPKDEWGETPALEAARAGRRDVVELLLSMGANSLVRERKGGRSIEEWIAVGGLVGLHGSMMLQRSGQVPEGASVIRKLMAQAATVEEYAAYHGRHTYVFSYGSDDLPDIEANRWAKRYAEILRTPDLLAECEERFLTGEKLQNARKLRDPSRRSLERRKLREERVRRERAATSE